MPLGHPPVRPHPGKPLRSLKDAARDGQLIAIRCNLCHRKLHFLPADLARLYGDNQPATSRLFPCSRCKTGRYMDIKLFVPDQGEAARLFVRRLVDVKRTPVWRTEPYSDAC